MNNLKYEPLNDVFVEDLLKIWGDTEVIKYTNIKAPCSLSEIKDRVERLKEFDVFVVSNKGDVVGIIGCPCIDKDKLQFGLFYQFCKSSWGKGYGTKTTEWLLEYMKEKYGETTIFADVVVDNIASEKILKKFGFKFISEEILDNSKGDKVKVHNYRL